MPKHNDGEEARAEARASLHPWLGEFHCPICDEPFAFRRGQDGQPDLKDAFIQVAHEHNAEHPDGIWVASVYRRRKGGRYPEEARTLRLIVAEQKAARSR